MFEPFNNEQPCPERPAAYTAPGVKVYYSDYVINKETPQRVKAVYAIDGNSFDLRTDVLHWAGCTVNAISEVQRSSPEGFPHEGATFLTQDGYYFLVTDDGTDHRQFKNCLEGEGRIYRIVRNFVLGSKKIGHEIVVLAFNSSGEVINAEVDISASDYSRVDSGNSVKVVNHHTDFTESNESNESTTEIEEISERIENLQAEICNEEARIQKLREFFALADELGYSVVKKHQG